MRKRNTQDGISVHAIAGTYVVLLGINATEMDRSRLLGFAIEREDHTERERYWLKGFRFYLRTVAGRLAQTDSLEERRAVYLDPTTQWLKRHFAPGRFHCLRRELFK